MVPSAYATWIEYEWYDPSSSGCRTRSTENGSASVQEDSSANRFSGTSGVGVVTAVVEVDVGGGEVVEAPMATTDLNVGRALSRPPTATPPTSSRRRPSSLESSIAGEQRFL